MNEAATNEWPNRLPRRARRDQRDPGGGMGCLRRRHQPDRVARLPERRSRKAARRRRAPAGRRSTWRFAGPGGRLIGAVPMYLKSHSYGEYVFDWGWADAYERAGGRYYPKLLCAVPFTPVPGPRLLVAPDAPAETRVHLVAGMVELARQRKLSSLHVNFPRARGFRGVRARPGSCRASASNSTGRTTATAISTTISPRSIRASARRSRRSGARRWPAASRSTC